VITIQVKQSVFIDLSAETIFSYLSALENLANWSSVISVGEKKAPESVYVGATIQATIRFLGKWRTMTFEMIEYEPHRSLTIKSISGIAPCLFCYLLEPMRSGGTSITQEAMIDLTEDYGMQTERLITDALHRQLKHDLLTLKDILEIRASLSQKRGEYYV
jgi:hypothetical protein